MTLVERLAGVDAGDGLADALARRANVLRLTEAAHHAALSPDDPGGLSHSLRAALAARIARLNAEPALIAHFDASMPADAAPDVVALADPATVPDGGLMGAVVAYVDQVASAPREASRADIVALQDAGMSDADIVRLAELVAFLAFEARVVAGLRLMRSVP